jgi:hypothetical protein
MGMGLGYSAVHDKILRSNRWTFYVNTFLPEDEVTEQTPTSSNNSEWKDTVICKAKAPEVEFATNKMIHLRETIEYPTRQTWKPINIEMYNLDRTSKLYQWFTNIVTSESIPFLSTFTEMGVLKMLDGEGNIVQIYALYNCYPKSFDFGGDLEYGNSKISKCKATINYTRAERLL